MVVERNFTLASAHISLILLVHSKVSSDFSLMSNCRFSSSLNVDLFGQKKDFIPLTIAKFGKIKSVFY